MSYTPDDLILAERHVEHAERFVRFQRSLLDAKRGRGAAEDRPEVWLAFFEAGLARHIAKRDKIAAELATRFP